MTDTAKMTAVFDYDVSRYWGNPHKAETAFGSPVTIQKGDACAELTAAHAELVEARDEIEAMKTEQDSLLRSLERHHEELKVAHAEIERLKSLVEWQDIETAPKVKGHFIEVGFAGLETGNLAYWSPDDTERHNFEWWDAEKHSALNPTHWRPHAPPSSQSQEAGESPATLLPTTETEA